jgi:GrpB-like predicted nucleotidyltransferase (UPF0157 family)
MEPTQSQAAEVEEPFELTVRIHAYDPEWPLLFAAERAVLEGAVGEWAVGGIHHVGSTAIEGVDAEAVIDILLATRDDAGTLACLGPLAALGYRPESPPPSGGYRLGRAAPGGRRFDLRLVAVDNPRYAETLAFRECLRGNRQVALGYAGMKRDLIDRHAGDRQGYAAARAELIEVILASL